MRSPEWSGIFPADCDECPHRICKTGAEIHVAGVGWCDRCPREWLGADVHELRAAHDCTEAWRHWKHGNLSGVVPDPSDAMLRLIIWVDDEVGAYQQSLVERAKAEAGGNR